MSKKILCVDDDPDILDTMSIVLESEGYIVITAEDGPEGLAKAKAEKPHLILLDVMMNYQDEGFQTAYQLQKDPELRDIPVVLITAITKVTGLRFDMENDENFPPVEGFVEKPISPEELLAIVHKYIG
jgi:CheY-like chemotaxis protein